MRWAFLCAILSHDYAAEIGNFVDTLRLKSSESTNPRRKIGESVLCD